MFKFQNVFLLLSLMSVYSCQEDNSISKDNTEYSFLIEEETLRFASSSPFTHELSDVIYKKNELGEEYLLILNDSDLERNKSLTIYELTTEKAIEKIDILEEGPNSISNINETTLAPIVTDLKSIFFWNGNTREFHLIGKDRRIEKKNSWPENNYNAAPNISRNTPAIRTSYNDFFFPLMVIPPEERPDYTDFPAIAKMELTDNQFKVDTFLVNFPKIYNNGFYGVEPYLYVPSIQLTQEEDLFVSFPIDHTVYQFDTNGKLKNSLFVKSNYIEKEIKPYKDSNFFSRLIKGEIDSPSLNDRAEYIWTTSKYESLIKLPSKNEIYGRIVNVAPSIEEVRESWGSGKNINKFTIIFFNDEEIIGEQLFKKEDYSFYSYFITNEKIFFFNNKKSMEDDDYFYFTGFSFRQRN
ncbi:MAG: hypothetical protein MK226_18665 [Saprospiraceae bacterium]|jgi:hypothetical protein|nr:hypothetical protein [Saprospiraceae bacterium]